MAYYSRHTGEEVDSLLDKVKEGDVVEVDTSLSSTSKNPVQNKVVTSALSNKQDKLISGTNIKTINSIPILGEGNIIISGGGTEGGVSYEEVEQMLAGKQNVIDDLDSIREGASKGATALQEEDLSSVAISGDYNDLTNKPTIPSAITEETVSGWGFTKNEGTYIKPDGGIPSSDLSNDVQSSLNKADTALQSYTEQYKGTVTGVKMNGEVKGTSGEVDLGTVITEHQDISGKQDVLVSGENIKTINGVSILGEGDILIEGGGESYDDTELRNLISEKQDALVSGQNIKTINGSSLLGAGNIVIASEGGVSYDDTELRNLISNKVDKVEGKALSTNDFTDADKTKLDSLENYDDTNVVSLIRDKQDKLVSGTNIKTINGTSILGEGNIDIEAGVYDDTELRNMIAEKQDTIEDLSTIRENASKGATALQSVPSEYMTEDETRANFVKKGAYIMPTNPFDDYKMTTFGFSFLSNALYAADKRFDVQLSGFGYSDINRLFDGNYESQCHVTAGNTGVITISNNGANIIDGYSYGEIYVSFYYDNIPQDVTVRAYCNYEPHGIGWKTLALSNIRGDQNGTYTFSQTWHNITQLEITVVAKEDVAAYVTQIDWSLNRSALKNLAAVTKFGIEQELFGKYKFADTISLGGKEISSWDDLGYVELQQQLSTKADINGDYPDMSVGLAEDLGGRPFTNDAEFSFRATADKENSIKDGLASIKTLKGNSVVWNQSLLQTNNYVESGVTSSWNNNICTLSGESSQTYINITSKRIPCSLNEKWALIAEQISNPNDVLFKIGLFNSSNGRAILGNGVTYSAIIINSDDASKGSGFGVDYFGGVGTDLTGIQFKVKIISLTKMFGAGNEPTTIEEYNARKPKVADEYAYNEGEVIHCNTESIKSVGDNAWDEEWITGRLNTNTGQPNLGNNGITSKNYIRVLPNETYYCGYNAAPIFAMFYDAEYALITGVNGSNNFVSIRNTQFTTPANAAYMKFYVADNNLTTYNNDIMISLVHSGWKQDTDAGYQPYWQDILPLPIIRKYFPDGMKLAGSAHDEIRYNKASGKWEAVQRIGEVDMGTLKWGYNNYGEGDASNRFSLNASKFPSMKIPSSNEERNVVTSKYSTSLLNTVRDKDKVIMSSVYPNEIISIKDTAYTDVASFKAAMAGVILYYELAEPIVTELDEADQNFRDYYNVADFGTEQAIGNSPSAPISAEIEYNFGANDTIRTNKLAINKLREKIKEVAIEDIDTIRDGAAKGMTAIQEHQDISHLATKEELAEINTAISNRVELKYYVRDVSPVTLSSAALNSCYIYTGAAGDVRINNLANPTSSEARYEFRFSGATSLTIPSKVIWANGEVPEIDSTAYYELSIVATQTADGYVYKAVLGKFM